jgi:prepilin-type N-terminal cleavage/methylation domain-containing protein/prepilin-type processing-associated H-X9-DG protein
MSHRTPTAAHRHAFTLVELLVVIGIIALLISMLLPALNKAREAASSAKCLSNVRQMITGTLMYADANRGYLPPTSLGSEQMDVYGTTRLVARSWFGGAYGSAAAPDSLTTANVTTGRFFPPGSPIHKYWGVASAGGCPSFQDVETLLRPGYGPTSYAYSDYCGRGASGAPGPGTKLSRFKRTSEKAVFWDSARILPPSITFDRVPWGYGTTGNPGNGKAEPNFHGRHARRGNVAWLDGHASSLEPVYFGVFPTHPQLNSPLLKARYIGNIDSDMDQTTDEHFAPTP